MTFKLLAANPDGETVELGIYETVLIESPALDVQVDEGDYVLTGWEGDVSWWKGTSRYWTETGYPGGTKYTKLLITRDEGR